MRALVTGGTGFVGSHLLEALGRHGIETRALVRSIARAEALGLPAVEWVRGDLGDPAALARAASGVDMILHVAGLVAGRSPEEYHEVNVEGTRRLLAASEQTGARFILVSSLAAGGPTVPGRPLLGHEPPRPVSSYGRSKLAAETVVREGPLAWSIIRPPTVYGPRDTEVLRLFRSAAWSIAPVFGTGEQELSLVYGPDLAEALVATALAPEAIGRILYPAHPERVTQAGLARAVGEAMGRSVRVTRVPVALARAALRVTGATARLTGRRTLLTPDKGNEFFQAAWTCDPAGLEEATGWRATHDLATGLARTAAWYRAHGWL